MTGLNRRVRSFLGERAGLLALAMLVGIAGATIGAGFLVVLSLISPYALTFGEKQLGVAGVVQTGAVFFLVAAAAKFAGTSLTIASGWRGGFIIPLFFVGMCVGRAIHQVVPGVNEAVIMAAMMAGINTGVTKTPLGSTLVVTRMAGFHLMPTTLLSAVVALLLTQRVGMVGGQRGRG